MKKILVITTKGCEGCRIINNLIKQALTNYKDVEYETKDKSEVSDKLLKANYVNDFPATFLIRNNEVKFVFVGTRPVPVISRYIDVNLF